MAELLLELFSEEIPSRMQVRAAEDIKTMVTDKLSTLRIGYETANAFVTPRRLTLVIDGIPPVQPDVIIEKKGPRIDAPAAALEGFLRSVGMPKEQLEQRETDKGTFYFAVMEQKGVHTSELLIDILKDTLHNFTWPKSMRWGASSIRWVRPLHNILCLFDGKVLPITFGNLEANRESCGHRFLSKGSFEVRYFADYQSSLRERHVILNTEERKALIQKEADKLAKEKGLVVKEDPALLEEVAGLVEWPHVLMGSIDQKFMSVPQEVLSTSMRSHQKYFSLLNHEGHLAPYFIVVANMIPHDSGKAIIAGNERVLRARLSDAKFFYEQDQKKTLEARIPDLDKITFHAKLGSIGDKTRRIADLAKYIAVWVPHANLRLVERASMLCKTDLVSEMVMEFPELQGIMGAYYAKHDQEDPSVIKAIGDHYQPLGAAGYCPLEPVSITIALADKIDSLTGLFAADEKPTGSKDPFALRRACLGVIRMILENQLRIPLRLVLEKAVLLYPSALLKGEKAKASRLVNELLDFFSDRLKASLKAQAIRHDLINAVFNEGNEDDFLRLVNRVLALQTFLGSEKGNLLLMAYKRAYNIVALEEKKDKTSYNKEPSKDKLIQKEEQLLLQALDNVRPQMLLALKEDQFEKAMSLLEALEEPIKQFFENVTVNCENMDVRRNRLMILSQVRGLLDGVANFDKIEG